MTAEPLTVAQLDELIARCRALGAPVVDLLQPGLSDANMDALTTALGL